MITGQELCWPPVDDYETYQHISTYGLIYLSLVLPFISQKILGKLLNFSDPQFSFLLKWD